MSNHCYNSTIMENYEFIAASDGTIIAKSGRVGKVITEADRCIIEQVIEQIRNRYPASYKRLCKLYERYKDNIYNYEYRIAKRFVRCNLGADDLLSTDLSYGKLNLEFVSCPLRGECCDEHVICCPQQKLPLSDKLAKVAELYASGMSYKEMAFVLKKSEKTIANQLRTIAKKLGLKRIKDIINYRIN